MWTIIIKKLIDAHNPWRVQIAAILSSIERAYVLSYLFSSKPSIAFLPHKPFYNQPNYSSWCLLQAIQLIASPDLNKNKGVAETAPNKTIEQDKQTNKQTHKQTNKTI